MRERAGIDLSRFMADYDRWLAGRARYPTYEDELLPTFERLRDEIIRPLMQRFLEVLHAHGHACRVYYREPSVTAAGNLTQSAEIVMCIAPKPQPDADEGSSPSYNISFELARAQRKLRARVTHGPWAEACSSCPHSLHSLDEANSELVEAELLKMLRHVIPELGNV
jgi:hypothetical protein